MTYKNLAPEIQSLLSDEQKSLINQGLAQNTVFIINGPQIQTGKTTLVNALREIGAQAFEPFELMEITLTKHLDM